MFLKYVIGQYHKIIFLLYLISNSKILCYLVNNYNPFIETLRSKYFTRTVRCSNRRVIHCMKDEFKVLIYSIFTSSSLLFI